MTNKTKFKTIFIALLAIVLSCNDDDTEEKDCRSTKIEYFTSVNAPGAGSVNEPLNIELKFQVNMGCGAFNRFIETSNGNSIDIEVEAVYTGCICTTDMPIITVNYEFIPQNPGTYQLNFRSSPDDFISITLNID